jgi:CRP/FNR family transcriptional regulator
MTSINHSIPIDYFSGIPYFGVLAPSELNTITRQATFHTFSPDELIFLEGDRSSGLWIIQEGSVKITKYGPEGDEYILHLLGPGDSFNGIAALDGGPTPANAVAMSLMTGWSIPSAVLIDALQRYPQMAQAAITMMAGRVRDLTKQIEDLTLYPVTARLARFLLSQAENPALSGPGITRAAIAAHLATTPETISRVLARLQDEGAIRFDRHRILIVDRDLLRSIAEL